MLSKGYFKITKEGLKKLLKTHGLEYAKRFIQEMFNYGGRISFNEYEYWLNFLKKEVAKC